MYESLGTGKSLDEEVFEEWLEKGRASAMSFMYLLILWNADEEEFQPAYTSDRDGIDEYRDDRNGRERLIAVYDLYSESRIMLH